MKTSLPSLMTLLIAAISLVRAGEQAGQPSASKPFNYFIVVTGGELLEGVYPDAHTPFLTRTLRPLGCQCVGSITVDDNRDAIQQAMRYATNHAPLVIVTGGLGPTPNDITRQTLSEFTGNPLREHPDVLAELERRFNQSRDQLRPNVRRQAEIPTRGGYLKNPNGTAAGLIFDGPPSVIVSLPGPPRELQPMVRQELIPYLREHFGVRFKNLENGIREHLAEYIYADDGSSLEDVIASKLRARGGSLALVEIGSGGSLAAALSGAKESASVLGGAYVALTDTALSRLLGITPEQLVTGDGMRKAKILASVAATLTGSQWSICIGPVEADAKGLKSVCVAYKFPQDHWETQHLALRDSGEITRATLVTQVLDFLRKHF